MDVRFFQMLPNIRGRDPKFETLGDKIKIIPNFQDANCNVVFYFIYLFIYFFLDKVALNGHLIN